MRRDHTALWMGLFVFVRIVDRRFCVGWRQLGEVVLWGDTHRASAVC